MKYPKGISKERADKLIKHIREMAEIVGGKPGLNRKGRHVERLITQEKITDDAHLRWWFNSEINSFCPVNVFAPEHDRDGRTHSYISIIGKMIYTNTAMIWRHRMPVVGKDYPVPYEVSDQVWWGKEVDLETKIEVFNWLKTVEW